ncbi:MAG: hypothetical protein GEEBNDBF_02039 [bacterium]|nr:hypothetical protein [bacterium]
MREDITMPRSHSLIFLLLAGLLTAGPVLAAPIQQGNLEGTLITLDTRATLGPWTLPSSQVLNELRRQNPALSNIRVLTIAPGDAVAPGEAVRLQYGGMDRTYVSLLRYLPIGRVELALKNRFYNKLETRNWLIDVTADPAAEGSELWLSVTSRVPLPDDWFDTYAPRPDTITTDATLVGSTYTWYRVYDQTGMRIDRSGGQPYSGDERPLAPVYGESGSQGVVEQTLTNPYAAYGARTADQPNPYYRPLPRAGAYRQNPFLYRYGFLPYYSPVPMQVWIGPGGTLGQPYYLYDFGGVGVLPAEFYISPRERGVRTNFRDVLFSADITRDGLILRGGDDFIEGELAIGGRSGFSLRLRDVRDNHGRRFTSGQPLVVYIDDLPYYPLLDPATGDFYLPFPVQPSIKGGLGSRIRVQPANIRTGAIGIGRIEVNSAG